MFLRGSAQADSLLLVLRSASSDSFLPPRSISCAGLVTPCSAVHGQTLCCWCWTSFI
jgi:hypothetical protein